MSRMTSQAHRDAQAIDRLKGELQRVIAELRNRDKELNSMSAAHSRQMESWVGAVCLTSGWRVFFGELNPLPPLLAPQGPRQKKSKRAGRQC